VNFWILPLCTMYILRCAPGRLDGAAHQPFGAELADRFDAQARTDLEYSRPSSSRRNFAQFFVFRVPDLYQCPRTRLPCFRGSHHVSRSALFHGAGDAFEQRIGAGTRTDRAPGAVTFRLRFPPPTAFQRPLMPTAFAQRIKRFFRHVVIAPYTSAAFFRHHFLQEMRRFLP